MAFEILPDGTARLSLVAPLLNNQLVVADHVILRPPTAGEFLRWDNPFATILSSDRAAQSVIAATDMEVLANYIRACMVSMSYDVFVKTATLADAMEVKAVFEHFFTSRGLMPPRSSESSAISSESAAATDSASSPRVSLM
jgi:hypothetical protein